jgi:hypothetical protein
MKARKSKLNYEQPLSHSLNHSLLSYAAATAAGAGLLGVAQPADAHIVYTPAHAAIGYRGSYALDLTGTGETDFILHDAVSANCSTVFNALQVKPALGNAVEGGAFNGLNLAEALQPGETVGSSQKFDAGGRGGPIMGEAIDSPGGGQFRGNWVNVINRYLGLKFQVNGQTHFGWARLSVRAQVFQGMHAVLTGYAYETEPNTPIVAGQETGMSECVPVEPRIKGDKGPDATLKFPDIRQPASLGALALGAAGLSLWRRAEQTAA